MIPPKRQIPWIVQALCKVVSRLLGWHFVGQFDGMKKAVIICQHTSNWDGIYAIVGAMALGVRPRWLGKDTLFKGPIRGPFLRAVGGVEVDRSSSKNIVDQVVDEFAKAENLWLFVAPGSTRKYTDHWRTGFYHIAVKADVPIVQGIIDYKYNQVGIRNQMIPSGDLDADLEIFREWYSDHHPKYPEKAADIRLKPVADEPKA